MRKKINPVLMGVGLGLGVTVAGLGGLSLHHKFNPQGLHEPSDTPGVKDARAIAAIGRLGQAHNYVVLADTNHENVSIRDFIFRPQMIRMLAENGFKNITVEYSTSHQPLIDALTSGKISRDSFITTFQVIANGYGMVESNMHLRDERDKLRVVENFADFILEAKKHDIRILAVNGMEGYSKDSKALLPQQGARYLEFAKFIEASSAVHTLDAKTVIVDIYAPLMDGVDKETAKEALQKNPKTSAMTEGLEKLSRYDFAGAVYRIWAGLRHKEDIVRENVLAAQGQRDERAFILSRLSQDDGVAARIRELSRGEKTLVIYGLAHSFHTMGNLPEKLDHAPTLMMIESVEEYRDVLLDCASLAYLDNACEIGKGHYIFLYKEGYTFAAKPFGRKEALQALTPSS